MDYSIRWSPEAIEDFERIETYLSENWSVEVVNNFKQKLSKRLELIKKYPKLHVALSSKMELRRSVLNKQISIIYTVKDDVIFIVGLLDNRSDHDYQ